MFRSWEPPGEQNVNMENQRNDDERNDDHIPAGIVTTPPEVGSLQSANGIQTDVKGISKVSDITCIILPSLQQ